MKKKFIIRKLIVLTAWLLVGSGMIVLLAAASREQQEQLCKRVVISVKGDGEKVFIEKTDVMQQLKLAAGGSLVNKPVIEFNLLALEKTLEKHSWIRDVNLYFDSRHTLHVSVSEREPIARIFTTSGQSFYIDSAGKRLPLLDKIAVRVPVVTNFTSSRRYNAKDSLLLNSVKTIAKYINAHTFWSAQIAQVDVLPGNTFELVPVVGNHLIRIGNADNLEEKLDRLFLFYKQVAAKSGFDKYAVLDVQYDRQVIGSKSRFTSEVDSIQLQKNIEALIKKSKDAAFQDSLAEIAAFNAQVHRDTTIKNLIYRLEEEAKEQEKELDPKTLIDTQTVKAKVPAKVGVKQVTKTAAKKSANPVRSNVKPKPKAVMKKKDR
ncbi:MAG TPA: hypothetical protein VGB56_10065 [Flavisolibacter sp.]